MVQRLNGKSGVFYVAHLYAVMSLKFGIVFALSE
jgi:hypothetical protein